MSAIEFPVKYSNGSASLTDYKTSIRQSVLAILGTEKGSFGFDRAFGSNIGQLIFEPNSSVLRNLLHYEIQEAMKQENRVVLKKIEILQNENIVTAKVLFYIKQLDEYEKIDFELKKI